MRRVGPGPRPEFLRAPAEHLRGVQISLRVGGEFMDGPEQPGRGAVRAPGVHQMPVQVVLEELVERAGEHPEKLIVADADVVRLLDVGELIEVLAVLVEHLNAVVRAIGDVDAPVPIDRDARSVGRLKCLSSLPASSRSPSVISSFLPSFENLKI
jgi:hypothetical protein